MRAEVKGLHEIKGLVVGLIGDAVVVENNKGGRVHKMSVKRSLGLVTDYTRQVTMPLGSGALDLANGVPEVLNGGFGEASDFGILSSDKLYD